MNDLASSGRSYREEPSGLEAIGCTVRTRPVIWRSPTSCSFGSVLVVGKDGHDGAEQYSSEHRLEGTHAVGTHLGREVSILTDSERAGRSGAGT